MKQKLLDDGTLYVEVKHALQVKRVLIEDREHWGTMFYPEEPIDLVRCAECRYHEDFPTGRSPITCSLSWGGVFENDFCSYGDK